MRLINELGLDLERKEVRKKVVGFLMGANVEFKYAGLGSADCKGRIVGYRNEIGGPDFSIIILAVGGDFPFVWPPLDDYDNIIRRVDSKTKKAFVHISDISISNISADALVTFVKGNN